MVGGLGIEKRLTTGGGSDGPGVEGRLTTGGGSDGPEVIRNSPQEVGVKVQGFI